MDDPLFAAINADLEALVPTARVSAVSAQYWRLLNNADNAGCGQNDGNDNRWVISSIKFFNGATQLHTCYCNKPAAIKGGRWVTEPRPFSGPPGCHYNGGFGMHAGNAFGTKFHWS